MSAQIPTGLLAAALAVDAARPFLTYYDDATAERVELSVATFENWVAKTAGLLRDELGAEPGERVVVRLPTHWQSAVVLMAAWACELVVTVDPDSAGQDSDRAFVVCGPDGLAEATAAGFREVLALSLRPLGGPFAEPLPPAVVDFGLEAPRLPDRFVPLRPPPPRAPAWLAPEPLTQGELVERAQQLADPLGVRAGDRVLTTANPATASGLWPAMLVPLAAGASVVLVRNADPARAESRMVQERVTRLLE